MTMRLCIDIDNVLAQSDEVMRRVIIEVTEGRVKLSYNDIRSFNYYECKDSDGNRISKDEWATVHSQFSEAANIRSIHLFPGVQEHLQRLVDIYDLHFVTSRLGKARQATVEWLEVNRFPMHSLHFVDHREKHSVLTNFDGAIEDDYDQAKEFAIVGTPTYLMRHPWNSDRAKMANLRWVDNWNELAAILCGEVTTND